MYWTKVVTAQSVSAVVDALMTLVMRTNFSERELICRLNHAMAM